MVETCLPFFLCLLAVHPDFSNEPDDLELFEKYINYYFDIYANEKNISLIYHLAGQTKQYKIQDQEISEENLWIVAELALMVIHHRAKERSWVVSPWNGALNPRWFKHMKELPQQQASSVNTVVYFRGSLTHYFSGPASTVYQSRIHCQRATSYFKFTYHGLHATETGTKRNQTKDHQI